MPQLALEPDGVDVWMVPATAPIDQWRDVLTEEEWTGLRRLHFPADARREAASRGARRRLLGQYLDAAPRELRFVPAADGKPGLDRRDWPDWQFNASHSGDWALVAIARGGRVGVDIEIERELADRDHIVGRFFAPPERQALARWPADRKTAAFFRAWTLKEACLKAVGAGLPGGLDSFAVRLGPDEAPAVSGGLFADGAWTLGCLDAPRGYHAGLAAEAPLRTFRLRELGLP